MLLFTILSMVQATADSLRGSPVPADSEAEDSPPLRCIDAAESIGHGLGDSDTEASSSAASAIDALNGCLIRLRLALERAQAHALLPFNVDALIARLVAAEDRLSEVLVLHGTAAPSINAQ